MKNKSHKGKERLVWKYQRLLKEWVGCDGQVALKIEHISIGKTQERTRRGRKYDSHFPYPLDKAVKTTSFHF